jgi:SAM-dependent methyltransferase
MQEGYRHDLAQIHDAGYSECAVAAVPAILRLLQKQQLATGLIVELGCGSGWTAQGLTEAGYDVIAIDQSPALIDLARTRAPKARFHTGSLFDFDIPNCHCVLSIGECCNYLFDRRDPAGRLRLLFERVYHALIPGGLFVFDLAEPGQVQPGSIVQTFTEGDGWTVLVEKQEDTATNVLSRRIVSFRREGDLYRREEEIHHLRLYPPQEVATALRTIGFQAQVKQAYGQYELPPAHSVFIATKPDFS